MNWLKATDFTEKHGIQSEAISYKIRKCKDEPFYKLIDNRLFIDEDYFINKKIEYQEEKNRAGDLFHLLTDKEGFDLSLSNIALCFEGKRKKQSWIVFMSGDNIFSPISGSIIATQFSDMTFEFRELAEKKVMELLQEGQYCPTGKWAIELCQEYLLEAVA